VEEAKNLLEKKNLIKSVGVIEQKELPKKDQCQKYPIVEEQRLVKLAI